MLAQVELQQVLEEIIIYDRASACVAWTRSTMSSSLPSSLESLIISLVEPARNDRYLKDELLLHCQDILNRYSAYLPGATVLNIFKVTLGKITNQT